MNGQPKQPEFSARPSVLPENEKWKNKSWKNSMSFRLMTILVGLSLFVGLVLIVFLSAIYQGRIGTEYMSKAVLVSKIAASMVDSEAADRYLQTLEKDEEYHRILALLQVQQRESDVTYVYIFSAACFINNRFETHNWGRVWVQEVVNCCV